MTAGRVRILLADHGFEDLTPRLSATGADEVLALFVAACSPRVLAVTGGLPDVLRADTASENGQAVFVAPGAAYDWLPDPFRDALPGGEPPDAPVRVEVGSAVLLIGWSDAAALEAALLSELGGADAETPADAVDGDLAADFAAFAFGWLLLEIVSRHVLYEVVLDEDAVEGTLVAAARACVGGETAEARDRLEEAFGLLAESRDVFFPVECDLLELRAVGPGAAWAAADVDDDGSPVWFALANDWDATRDRAPEFFDALRSADRSRHAIACGFGDAGANAAAAAAEVHAAAERAAGEYRSLFGVEPAVWSVSRHDAGPLTPAALVREGTRLVLAPRLGRGQGPPLDRGVVRWGGPQGPTVPTLGGEPIDAGGPRGWLDLAPKLAQTVEVDDPAVVLFLRKGPETPAWYRLFRRLSGSRGLLGRFAGYEGFLERTGDTLRRDRPRPGDYRAASLRRDVAVGRPDPISSVAGGARKAWNDSARDAAAEVLRAVSVVGAGPAEADGFVRLSNSVAATGEVVVVNPLPFDRRVLADVTDVANALPRGVVTQADAAGRAWAAADLPAGGYRVLRGDVSSDAVATRTPLAFLTADRSATLRNEFFEATVLARTGGLASIRRYGRRERRLSQRLGFRHRDVAMVADEIAVAAAGPLFGEVVGSGRFLDGDETVGRFRQTFRLARHSRVIEWIVELSGFDPPEGDPRYSAVVNRLAWADSAAPVRAATHQLFGKAGDGEFASATAVRIDDEVSAGGLTFLPRGLAAHRRVADRVLETPLIVAGESSRTFSFAVAVDEPDPGRAATADAVAPIVIRATEGAGGGGKSSAWLWRLDGSPTVLLVRAETEADEDGDRLVLDLLETSGRPSACELQFCREPAEVRRIDPQTGRRKPLEDRGRRGGHRIELKGHESLRVAVGFTTATAAASDPKPEEAGAW